MLELELELELELDDHGGRSIRQTVPAALEGLFEDRVHHTMGLAVCGQ
jgi:hypothetical protein